jgi:hypothetical protein
MIIILLNKNIKMTKNAHIKKISPQSQCPNSNKIPTQIQSDSQYPKPLPILSPAKLFQY